jgi:Cu2+-containing amine oxidase
MASPIYCLQPAPPETGFGEPGKERMMKTAGHATVQVRHPLDPLTAEEIEAAGRILRRDRGPAASARFVYVTLREPPKDAVLRYRRGEAFERQAHVVLRERAECRTYEAVVSITAS